MIKKRNIKLSVLLIVFIVVLFSYSACDISDESTDEEIIEVIETSEVSTIEEEIDSGLLQIVDIIEITDEDVLNFISYPDKVTVLQGSEDIDFLSLIDTDETAIESVTVDSGTVDFAETGEYEITYHIEANVQAFFDEEQVLVLDDEPQVFEFTSTVSIVSEREARLLRGSDSDAVIYATGMEAYEPLSEASVEEYAMYSSTWLNVRSGPSVDYDRLFVLSLNQAVTVSSEVDNGWVYVTTEDGSVGYCNGSYLSEEKVTVTTNTSSGSSSSNSSGSSSGSSSSGSSSSSSVANSVIDGVVYRDNCTDAQWNQAVAYWNQVPSGLRSAFISRGWKMIVTNNDFWTSRGYSSLAGITIYDSKLIYIRASNMRTTTFGHELGHFLDYINGFPSQSSTFASYFASEKSSFVEYDSRGDQSKTSAIEFWAAIVAQLFVAPNTESTAPNSFAYVRQYMLW